MERDMHTIEVDDEVMNALKNKAEPFVDTPNSVLRRLLLVDGAGATVRSSGRKRSRVARRTTHSATSGSKKAERVPTGAILPEREYVKPLLQVLHERGGRAPAREVIEEVGHRLDDRLTPLDKQPVSSGGVRWQNRVQFARLRLIDRGLLKRQSPRGLWELTEQGAAFLAAPDGA
jgi:Mrr N-terminal domain